jgi:hypothetical protein
MGKGTKPVLTAVGTEHCKCSGCKKPESKFTFCDEHYEWFDKKSTHYAAYVEKQKHYKVA